MKETGGLVRHQSCSWVGQTPGLLMVYLAWLSLIGQLHIIYPGKTLGQFIINHAQCRTASQSIMITTLGFSL